MLLHKQYWLTLSIACWLIVGCTTSKNAPSAVATVPFPQGWQGKWRGELQIFREGQLVQAVPMGLDIFPTDTSQAYTWTISYGSGETKDVRHYILLPKDPTRGHYVTDEKNGIFLDDFYANQTLYSQFSVGESLLTATYRLENGRIVFDIISSSLKPMRTSGGSSEEVPAVQSYRLPVVQRAILSKE